MSMEGIGPRGVGPVSQQQGTQDVQGKLGDHQVEVGEAQPRAGNALKTFFLEVKHFFASLFGVRVSTAKPERIDTVDQGAKAVISDLTRKDLDTSEVMKSLGALWDRGQYGTREARNEDNSPNIGTLFRDQMGEMSDLQLLRLYTNLSQHHEFFELVQGGRGLGADVAGQLGGLSDAQMRAIGKLCDFGWLAHAVAEDVVAELKSRGHDVAPIEARPQDDISPEIEAIGMRAILNGGDVGKAVDDLRQETINARLERSGLPTLDQLSQPRPESTTTPEQGNVINQRLELSGLPKLGGEDLEDRYAAAKLDLGIAGLKLQDVSSPAQMRELNKALNDSKALYKEVFTDLDDEGIDEAVVNDLLRQVGDRGALEILSKLDQFAGDIRGQDRDHGLLNKLYDTLSERAPSWGRGNPFV